MRLSVLLLAVVLSSMVDARIPEIRIVNINRLIGKFRVQPYRSGPAYSADKREVDKDKADNDCYGFSCKVECEGWTGCKPVCTKGCDFKRLFAKERKFPWHFSSYDENQDNQISLEEFAAALKSTKAASKKVFKLGDKDGDGVIDHPEFALSPFIRQHYLEHGLEQTYALDTADEKAVEHFLETAEKEAEYEYGPGPNDKERDLKTDKKRIYQPYDPSPFDPKPGPFWK